MKLGTRRIGIIFIGLCVTGCDGVGGGTGNGRPGGGGGGNWSQPDPKITGLSIDVDRSLFIHEVVLKNTYGDLTDIEGTLTITWDNDTKSRISVQRKQWDKNEVIKVNSGGTRHKTNIRFSGTARSGGKKLEFDEQASWK